MRDKISKLQQYTILFVEDEIDIVEMVSDTLSKLNINFFVAFSGQDGINKAIANDNINLIITDINMPVMNGFDMIKEIQNKKPTKCQYIITSAYTEQRHYDMAKFLHIDDYMIKPFDFLKLLDIVDNY
jgi:DNA-binding response OmpR family regulator